MRNERNFQSKQAGRGFSLIELLVVVAMISLVLTGILTQIEQVQQRSIAEQGKVDDFQQARDFLDQIFQDTRQMGFPNLRNYDTSLNPPTNACTATATWTTATINGLTSYANDCRMAIGLVKLTATELDLQGDVDGSGRVSVVSYKINGNGNCTTCIQRAQVYKVTGDALTGQSNLTAASYTVEVQNVQNTTSVFSAFDVNGNAVTLPIDMTTSSGKSVAQVRTIQAQLKIASPTAVDPKTRQQIEADIEGRVQVVNCSMATTLSASGLTQIGEVMPTCQ